MSIQRDPHITQMLLGFIKQEDENLTAYGHFETGL